MHGYGYPPEQQQPTRRPSSATLITLRVVFVALALLSCGVLTWAVMLRLAIVTRRQRDWWLFGLVLALDVGFIVYTGSLPPEEEVLTNEQAAVMLSWFLVVFIGTVTYYLYTDIRHYGPYGTWQGAPQAGRNTGPQATSYAGPFGGYAPRHVATTPAPSYGYPPAPQRSPVPTPPPVPPAPPAATPPLATPPLPLPDAPRTAAPQRLDQVRAELDELSDYLRKEGESR